MRDAATPQPTTNTTVAREHWWTFFFGFNTYNHGEQGPRANSGGAGGRKRAQDAHRAHRLQPTTHTRRGFTPRWTMTHGHCLGHRCATCPSHNESCAPMGHPGPGAFAEDSLVVARARCPATSPVGEPLRLGDIFQQDVESRHRDAYGCDPITILCLLSQTVEDGTMRKAGGAVSDIGIPAARHKCRLDLGRLGCQEWWYAHP